MSVAADSQLIGTTGLYCPDGRAAGFAIRVVIKDIRTVYGNRQFLITPCEGRGEARIWSCKILQTGFQRGDSCIRVLKLLLNRVALLLEGIAFLFEPIALSHDLTRRAVPLLITDFIVSMAAEFHYRISS